MTGTFSLAAWICSTSWGPLIRPCRRCVHEHDIGAQLADLAERLATVGQDVEDLDRLLGVEQATDVLGDLWDVLDDEQARLVTAVRHANRRYHASPCRRAGRAGGEWPTRLGRQRRSATRTTRSEPGPIGERS